MSYSDVFFHIKETYPNVHVEPAFDGWDWFFSNGELVATFNEDTGELVNMKEVA